jgi:hypothetical protein
METPDQIKAEIARLKESKVLIQAKISNLEVQEKTTNELIDGYERLLAAYKENESFARALANVTP